MAGGLVGRCFCLWACFCLLVWPTTARAQFTPGQQLVYPYYYPDHDLTGNPPVTYSRTPSPVTGIAYGKYDARNCPQHATHKAPAGYKTRYDCAAIESSLVWVEAPGPNFRVRQEILEPTRALIADLNQHLEDRGDSRRITAWGHRTFARQVELRVINGCPDVWQARSSSCRTPTAKPGYSRHETGHALDFYYTDGNSYVGGVSSQSDPVFIWLRRHAASYGFYNYDPEPWHWSIDGH